LPFGDYPYIGPSRSVPYLAKDPDPVLPIRLPVLVDRRRTEVLPRFEQVFQSHCSVCRSAGTGRQARTARYSLQTWAFGAPGVAVQKVRDNRRTRRGHASAPGSLNSLNTTILPVLRLSAWAKPQTP